MNASFPCSLVIFDCNIIALTFLKRHGLLESPARFDVLALTWPEGQRRPTIEHFENAFDAVGQWEFYS